MNDWAPDLLGDPYEQLTIDLGDDPDGEGPVRATLVRRGLAPEASAAVIFVHGFTDYFFHTELADFFAEHSMAFYALDLRKCGRSRREGQTPHFVTDLALYDAELEAALHIVREETGGLPVHLVAHSTGGLVVPLWLDRLNQSAEGAAGAGVATLILDSPWFDLQGPGWMRTVVTQWLRVGAKVAPKTVMKLPSADAYGASLHHTRGGQWDYDLGWKPLEGFPVTVGWLNAVRRGHAKLHRGLDISVPALVLRSDHSHIVRRHSAEVDIADAVLDVKQIARWAGCLGGPTTVLPIRDARHDVFLSLEEPRAAAYAAVERWLSNHSDAA